MCIKFYNKQLKLIESNFGKQTNFIFYFFIFTDFPAEDRKGCNKTC